MKADGYPDVDPWVVDWFDENGAMMDRPAAYTPEVLAMMRPTAPQPPATDVGSITDEVIAGVPVWIYEPHAVPTGVVVYLHGGAFVGGSRALMHNVAEGLARGSGAVVVSVDYRLAPEDPFPAGLDDSDAVTRWVVDHADRWDVAPSQVAVAGESAGGNLSAVLTLRFRDQGGPSLAGQVLLYPAVDALNDTYASRRDYDGLVLGHSSYDLVVEIYGGGVDITRDPYAFPILAADLSGLPPAFVMVGGCDWLRDEGLAYAERLRDAGVPTEELISKGQPHGFLNLDFPASAEVYDAAGAWLRDVFAAAG
ncbi:MAG: alpha/beta hydrolase [Acidimicrobiales bacterium]